MFGILNHYKRFKKYGKDNDVNTTFSMYLNSLHIRLKYGIGSKDYLENRLFDKEQSHDNYINSVHYVIHKWSTVSKKFMPQASNLKLFRYRVDYLFAIFMYPGLDAMDYFRYQFYDIRHEKRKTFITEGGIVKMDKFFNGGEECKHTNKRLSNKKEFNKMFDDIVKRDWIISDECSLEEFQNFCDKKNGIIVKPMEEGGGKGIYKIDLDDNNKVEGIYKSLKEHHFIIEEIIVQHRDLRKLNPSSVNTVRVYSVSHNGCISITGATLRVGNGLGVTDNYSRGGLAAEIDIDSGIVISRAVSQNADSVIVHPCSGEIILGLRIPEWESIKKMVEKAHERVAVLGYVGWDVVVCEDNSITFLEANTCAGVELQQHPALIGKKPIYEKFMH